MHKGVDNQRDKKHSCVIENLFIRYLVAIYDFFTTKVQVRLLDNGENTGAPKAERKCTARSCD